MSHILCITLINHILAISFDKKPFYVIVEPRKKPKKGEKPERGINARIYQDEERVNQR